MTMSIERALQVAERYVPTSNYSEALVALAAEVRRLRTRPPVRFPRWVQRSAGLEVVVDGALCIVLVLPDGSQHTVDDVNALCAVLQSAQVIRGVLETGVGFDLPAQVAADPDPRQVAS